MRSLHGDASPQPPRGNRRGRRSGGEDTRGDILDAARAEFSSKGYDKASMRGIARAAGVDPALVHHYFDGKDDLFVVSMNLPLNPSAMLPATLEGDVDGMGERLVRMFLEIWGQPAARQPFLALLRSAMSNEHAAAMLRGFVTKALLGRVAGAVTGPDRELRVTAAASQLIGMAIVRYVVKVEPLASASDDEVVRLLAPTIQRYLAGPAQPQ